jgi:hypothetical protein
MFGWNLPILFHKYCIGVDKVLPEEHHRAELIKLIAILISGDNNKLIDDPSSMYDDKIEVHVFVRFLLTFVCELQDLLCDGPNLARTEFAAKPVFGTRAYAQELHGYMTGIVYSKMAYRNPAIPGIVIFLLLVLANTYATSLCKKPTTDIVKGLVYQIGLDPVTPA